MSYRTLLSISGLSAILAIILLISGCSDTREEKMLALITFTGEYAYLKGQIDALHGKQFTSMSVTENGDTIYSVSDSAWGEGNSVLDFHPNPNLSLQENMALLRGQLD